jgi:glucose/arabinose dehydrogenase
MKLYLLHKKNERRFSLLFFFFMIIMLSALEALSQTFPTGFSRVQVVAGLSNPTVMTQAPDGRFFIAQQNGVLKVVKNGVLLSTAAITLSVDSNGERGLIGIVLDPNFSTNNFVYLYYTVPTSPVHNRISRFTFSGDVIAAGSEVVLLDLNNLSTATNHNGGSMAFGPDGKLYVAIGENANGSNAQTLDNYLGKILRINSDGSVPTGNPFSGNASRDRIWAYGLRNPYTITFQPGTSKLFVNDVGQNTWEEIDDATVGGKNFGWPTKEGFCSTGCTGFTNPVYAYAHGSGDGLGCAITGGAFFNPSSTNYPSVYNGKYFFMDYCNNWINYIDPANPATRNPFATNIGGSSLGIMTGNDGKLYYLSRSNSSLYRIDYTNTGSPSITAQPQNVTVSAGSSATFSVTATGTAPLNYQWRKNGINISGATASSYTIANVQPADAGTYSVIVSNTAGSATSNNATLTVSENTNPVATITSPANNSTYRAGNVINFMGTGTDAEDGSLPPSAFSWSVLFHHDAHTHPGPSVTVSSSGTTGSFTIPTLGETAANVWYELILTVTDSNGSTNTSSVRLNPITSTLTLASSPSGLQVKLDDQPVTAPYSVLAVSGMVRTLDVVTPQTLNGSTYVFGRWNNTTTQRQDITISDNATTYTATFYRSADNPTGTSAGLDYSYYEGNWNLLPDFTTLTPTKTGTISTFDLTPRNRNDQFAFKYTGFINIATDGTYTFYTSSDDGSRLYIGNSLVVDNDGLHGTAEKSGTINLKAGLHAITVTFFEQGGSEVLSVSYAGPSITKQIIPASVLFRASGGSVSLTLEAESAVRSGVVTSTIHTGYTGTGFGDYINATADYIEWTANVPMAGSYALGFRYALGSGTNRPLEIKVNGVIVVASLAFPNTTTWTNWTVVNLNANLNAGNNTIRATAIGSSGPNVDHLKVNSGSATRLAVESQTSLDELTIFPIPASDVLTITSREKLDFIDVSGLNGMSINLNYKQKSEREIEVNVSPLNEGLYLVRVKSGMKYVTKKISIKNK